MNVAETELDLRVINYPHEGDGSVLRTVAFGPASSEIALLIEVDPEGGEVPRITYTVGNGPTNEELAESVSEMLHEMADLISDAGQHPDFLAAVAEASADN